MVGCLSRSFPRRVGGGEQMLVTKDKDFGQEGKQSMHLYMSIHV